MKYPFRIIGALLLTAGLATTATAQEEARTAEDDYPRFRFGLAAATAFQDLQDDNISGTYGKLGAGFQAAVGNLFIGVDVTDGIFVYTELYLSSTHHPGYIMDREGYLRVDHLPEGWGFERLFEHIDIKAGHFEMDFGNQRLYRSDGGQVQMNPLIGNYLVDPNTVEAGIEVIGREGLFEWLVGFSSGVTTENFLADKGFAYHAKLSLGPERTTVLGYPAWKVSASAYRADHSGTPTGYPNRGSWTELFAGNRSGSKYAAVVGGGPDAGQLNVGKGQDVLAWQADAEYNTDRFRLYGHFGRAMDSDVNGSDPGEPEDSWDYYGVESAFHLTPSVYVAGRYSGARTDMFAGEAQPDVGSFSRYQVGGGVWLTRGILLKAEYVHQECADFVTQPYSDHPHFSGFVLEGSASLGSIF